MSDKFLDLKDKNGNDICEFNIVRHNDNLFVMIESKNIGIVGVCINEKLGSVLSDKKIMTSHNYRDKTWFKNVDRHTQIIGSIYEGAVTPTPNQ